jgi:peptide/nickel transport system permease protein
VARFIIKRCLWTIVVLWAVATLTFAATFLSPIDPAIAFAGPKASKAQIASVRHEFGLDQPLYKQYGLYLGRLARGNLGTSFVSGQSVGSLIWSRILYTAALALAAMAVQLSLGIPLGLVAAVKRGTLTDRAILVLSLVGAAAPAFVVGFVLLYLLAFKLGWFPLGGSASVSALVLPAITLGVYGAAWYIRMLRSAALNILSEDYIRMARSKGIPERTILFRHVLRNAIGPIVTMIGLDLGVFLGGVLIIEKVFAWPGIGLQAWQAIQENDIPMVLGTVLVAALAVTVLNLLADIANAVIDPRTRYG